MLQCVILVSVVKLQSKWFKKWVKKAKLDNKSLVQAIDNVVQGLAVDLGGGVFKVRVARKYQGKSGGFRTILLYKEKHMALFIYGFSKKEKGNIEKDELAFFKKQAKHIFGFKQNEINRAIEFGEFIKLED